MNCKLEQDLRALREAGGGGSGWRVNSVNVDVTAILGCQIKLELYFYSVAVMRRWWEGFAVRDMHPHPGAEWVLRTVQQGHAVTRIQQASQISYAKLTLYIIRLSCSKVLDFTKISHPGLVDSLAEWNKFR